MSLYSEAKALGLEMDSHESDLYLKLCPAAQELLEKHGHSYEQFYDYDPDSLWLDIPFAFDPYWEARGSKVDAPKDLGRCEWFLLCDKPATSTAYHPTLGQVPVCDDCNTFLKGDDE